MPGIYNDGIVTDLVKETFGLMGQVVELDFLSLNQVKGATFNCLITNVTLTLVYRYILLLTSRYS